MTWLVTDQEPKIGFLGTWNQTKNVLTTKMNTVFLRVSPTGVLQSDVVAKLKIDESRYELWNSVKKIQCSLHKNKI